MYGNQRQGNYPSSNNYGQAPVNYQQPNGGYMMQQQALPPGMTGMNMGVPQSGNRGYNMRTGQPNGYPAMEYNDIRAGMGGNGGYNNGQHQMQQMGGTMNNMHQQPNGYVQGQYNQNIRGGYNDGGQRYMMGNGDPRNQMQGNMMGKGNLGSGRMGNGGINGFNNSVMDGGFNNSDFPAIGGGMMNQNGGMGVNSYQNALQHMPAPQPPKPEFNMDEEDFPTLGGPKKKGGGNVAAKTGSGRPQQNNPSINVSKQQQMQQQQHHARGPVNKISSNHQQQQQQHAMSSMSHQQQRQQNNSQQPAHNKPGTEAAANVTTAASTTTNATATRTAS